MKLQKPTHEEELNNPLQDALQTCHKKQSRENSTFVGSSKTDTLSWDEKIAEGMKNSHPHVREIIFQEGKSEGQLAQMKEELEFLKKIEDYCDEMKMKVGVSILDDFNRGIKHRIKQLEEQLKQ